jgi:hypothetical protein
MGRENVKIKRLWLLCPLVILALLICTIQAYAIAPIPHAFYGTLTISGSPAPVGTVVTAKVGGVQYGSITTTVEGQYGSSDPLEERLLVAPGEGEVAEGATIDFYVTNAGLGLDEVKTVETEQFDEGGTTELNLTVTSTDDTTPPSVLINSITSPTIDTTPTFTGTATDTQSNIASVEYRVDSGSWVAATASDGTFDSLSEGYTFTTSTLSAGEHTVYVRATDAASPANTTLEADYATDTFTVEPPPWIPGDANEDGVVDILDVTKTERIIAMLDAETDGADANEDGVVDILDVTKIERIIALLD